VQIALRPKVSWGSSGIAGTVQIHCTDLCSSSGDRLGFPPPFLLHTVGTSSCLFIWIFIGRHNIYFGCGRLIVGQSLTLRRVVPILGVPDALVPLDLPVNQINLFPGYCLHNRS